MRTVADTADWTTFSLAAARVKLASSATTTNALICRSSMTVRSSRGSGHHHLR
ncbi:hypothetical protein ACRAWF_33595 [Streptomyces sp. L7]